MDDGLRWKTRIVHESMLWESNLFATLQYADDRLPSSLGLEYPDFQRFMYRLRARLEGERESPDGRRPVRFFVVGEYGGKSSRPHWHVVLFNLSVPDMRWWSSRRGRVGQSELLTELWGHGYVEASRLNARRAAYVAGYVHKKAKRKAAADVVDYSTGEVFERRPEFRQMSRDPGIGSWWYERFGSDLFPLDAAVVDGRRHKVPRYYWDKFRRTASAEVVEAIRQKRIERAMELPEEESSLERRAVREEAALARHDAFGGRGL